MTERPRGVGDGEQRLNAEYKSLGSAQANVLGYFRFSGW
jgi:hypothetical protein